MALEQNRDTGRRGEDIATQWLEQKGYDVLHRNWRFRHWEVDIIASRGNRLHFIEVKTRSGLRWGRPEESITKEKMMNLRHAAEEYQYLYPEWKYVQFDVIAITLLNGGVQEIFMTEDVYF